MNLTPDLTASLIVAFFTGSVFSFLLETLPYVRDLWDKIPSDYKILIVVASALILPFLIAAADCVNILLPYTASCPKTPNDFFTLFTIGFGALLSSQFAHIYVSKPAGVAVKKHAEIDTET